MKRQLAHAMRRTARRLIRWSNRLDRPTSPFLAGMHLDPHVNSAPTLGAEFIEPWAVLTGDGL